VPALKAAIEDLKAGRLQEGWEKLEHYGVIIEVIDDVELRERAVEQHPLDPQIEELLRFDPMGFAHEVLVSAPNRSFL
jgi:hypothetical protein